MKKIVSLFSALLILSVSASAFNGGGKKKSKKKEAPASCCSKEGDKKECNKEVSVKDTKSEAKAEGKSCCTKKS
jgi:hypothetical protein